MTAHDFIAWLDQLWLSDRDAAADLGVSTQEIARFKYEGAPKSVALACSALASDLDPWCSRRRKFAAPRMEPAAAVA